MPLESSLPSDISELEDLWPLSTDIYTQGDDHLRYIKAMLAAQFPGSNGQGFNKPIMATEDELNYLSGVTSGIQAQLDNIELGQDSLGGELSAPYGLRCLFAQAVAPTGWAQVTDYDDYMLRIVNTAGGGAGGSDSFFTHDWTHVHTTSAHQLTYQEMPYHKHSLLTTSDSNTVVVNSADKRISVGLGADKEQSAQSIEPAGGNQPHAHGDVQPNVAQFRPKYLNTILAENQNGYDTNTFYGYARSLSPIRYWRMDDD